MSGGEDALRKAVARRCAAPFGGVVRVETEQGALLWIDGRAAPPAVMDHQPEDLPADGSALAVLKGSRETLLRAFEDLRTFSSAYVSGRLVIAGDMSVMARLEFESGA